MGQFNIIDRLIGIFGETCAKQVVLNLIRNTQIWEFLLFENNLTRIEDILGSDPSNWTITKIVEAAAGIYSRPDSQRINTADDLNSDLSDLINPNTELGSLSETALRILDYLKVKSLVDLVIDVSKDLSDDQVLKSWVTVFSVIFNKSEDKQAFIASFSVNNADSSIKLFINLLYSDPGVSEYFKLNLEKLVNTDNLAWFVSILQGLLGLENGALARDFSNLYFAKFPFEIELIRNPPKELSDLLDQIEINHNLLSIAKIIGDNSNIEKIEVFSTDLINRLGEKLGFSIAIQNSLLDASTYLEGEGISDKTGYEILLNQICQAEEVYKTDVDSGKVLVKNIYSKFFKKELIPEIAKLLGSKLVIKYLELLLKCGLIVESQNIFKTILCHDPLNIDFLRISAAINHNNGNHQEAVENYQLLNFLSSLTREEKINLANSLEYCQDWEYAFKVRKGINSLNINDIKDLVFCAHQSWKLDEIKEIIDADQFGLRNSSLLDFIRNFLFQEQNSHSQPVFNEVWQGLNDKNEKLWFIEILVNQNELERALEFLIPSVNKEESFSLITSKLIGLYRDRHENEKISRILKRVGADRHISQSEFENFIDLLIEFRDYEKAEKLLNDFEKFWQLSPKKILQHAKIALINGDHTRAREIFSIGLQLQNLDDESLTFYALSLINSDPISFPFGFDRSNLTALKEIKDCFYRNSESKNLIHRIIAIDLQEIDKFEQYEKLLLQFGNHHNDEIWRIKAALGLEHFRTNQYDLAIRYFKEIERVIPFNFFLLIYLLKSYIRLKLWEEAETILIRILSIDGLDAIKLLHLSNQIRNNEEWLVFTEKQYQKYSDSLEIQLLYATALVNRDQHRKASEIAKIMLSNPVLENEFRLISAQIILLAGDVEYAKQVLDNFFSNSKIISANDFLTAAILYEYLGKVDQALIMLNHITHLEPTLTVYKANLLARVGRQEESLKILDNISLDNEMSCACKYDLPLIISTQWDSIIEDSSYISKTAADIYLSNSKVGSALSIIDCGLVNNPFHEGLSYLKLEILKLNEDLIEIDKILAKFESQEIQSPKLLCSLGESSLLVGEEINAAKFLSNCLKNNSTDHRVKALQARMLYRNGNGTEAKLIFSEILQNQLQLLRKNGDVINSLTKNFTWLAHCAFELKDYPAALDICRNEIEEKGYFNCFVELFLKSLLSVLRENIIPELLEVKSHTSSVKDEDIQLLEKIENNIFKKSRLDQFSELINTCKAYLVKDPSDLEKILSIETGSITLQDKIYSNYLLFGSEKTEILFDKVIQTHEDKILIATLLLEENPGKSLEIIEGISNLSSENPLQLALLARIQTQLGNFADAYSAITLALNIWPEEYAWETFAGEISKELGDMALAASHFEKAKTLSGNSTWAGNFEQLQELSEGESAIPVLESRLPAEQNNFNLLMRLGLLCQKFMKLGKAVNYFEAARKLEPRNTDPLLELSKISQDLGNLQKAEEFINLAIGIENKQADLIIHKAILITKTRSSREGLDYLEGKIKTNEDGRTEMQAALADLIFENYGLDECMMYLETLPDENVKSPILANIKIKYYLMAGDIQNANALGEKSLADFPDDPDINALNGEISRFKGDLDRAIDFYIRAIKIYPFKENFYLGLFDIYHERRDTDAAIQTLEKGISINQGSPQLLIESAKFYYQHGLILKGMEKIKNALRLQPNNEEARVLERLLKPQEVAFEFKKEALTE